MEEIPNNQLISSLIIRVYPIIYKVLYIQPLVGNGDFWTINNINGIHQSQSFCCFQSAPGTHTIDRYDLHRPPDIGGSSQVDVSGW